MKLTVFELMILLALPIAPASANTQSAIDHHPVSTKNPVAQQAFDDGMLLRYAFNAEAAEQAFQRAASLDPHLAMAWWGIALSNGVDINTAPNPARETKADAAITKAKSLLAYASPEERDYIGAMAERTSPNPKANHAALGAKFHAAMQSLAARYPNDPDASTLFAESALDLRYAYGHAEMAGMVMPHDTSLPDPEILVALNHALTLAPKHPGANHLLIHALDRTKAAPEALPSADVLATLTYPPGASHLIHMASHIYFRVGNYTAAIRTNEAALDLDQQYFAANPPARSPGAFGYHGHTATYLAFAAMTAQDWPAAQRAIREIPKTTMPLLVLTRFARWDTILATQPPTAEDSSNQPNLNQVFHMARGLAFLAHHNLPAANAERAALITAIHAEPNQDADTKATCALRLALLDARLHMAQHQTTQAVATLQGAMRTEDKIGPGELLPFFIPMREALGTTLLAAHRPAEAAAAFRDDLTRTIANPRSQRGLAEADTERHATSH